MIALLERIRAAIAAKLAAARAIIEAGFNPQPPAPVEPPPAPVEPTPAPVDPTPEEKP